MNKVPFLMTKTSYNMPHYKQNKNNYQIPKIYNKIFSKSLIGL